MHSREDIARIKSRPARQLARAAATVPPGQVSAEAAAGDEPRRRESLHERTRLIIGPGGELPRANQMPSLYVLTLRVPGGFPARRPSSASAPAGTSTSSTKAAAAHRSYEPPRPRRPAGVASGRSSSSASESLHASSLLSRVGMAAGETPGSFPAAARGEAKRPGRAVTTNSRPTTARLITWRWRFHFIRVPAPDGRARG
ncbi:hypothetical protein GQ55_2G038100 [Panicum hallii var. hallii]|uniref:Uncharacterized protein n=1 Tax=Panicum hallii var. hallii TaxID=1504633 RepID=A0A2T7EL55_9POAL|nr:hypothetical protein GQ55_2G038100 [Panicum hallii var. hallii]